MNGKEKKLNYSTISKVQPTGCTFKMNLTSPLICSRLLSFNIHNATSLPILFPEDIKTFLDYRKWLDNFKRNITDTYFAKVERMKHLPKRTVKYFDGDIFRFEVDLEHYGYGLIIGQLKKFEKMVYYPINIFYYLRWGSFIGSFV